MKYGIFPGRFQPFHNGHLWVIEHFFEIEKNSELVIGVVNPDPFDPFVGEKNLYKLEVWNNPFTYWQRYKMIKNALKPEYHSKVSIVPMPRPEIDYERTNRYLPPEEDSFFFIPILGEFDHWKMEQYQRMKPRRQIKTIRLNEIPKELRIIGGKYIRALYVCRGNWKDFVPKSTVQVLENEDVYNYVNLYLTYTDAVEIIKNWIAKYPEVEEIIGNSIIKHENILNRKKQIEKFLKDNSKIIEKLGGKFSQYQHPEGKIVDAKAIKSGLIQFETVERIRWALFLLEHITFIDRKMMIEMFSHYWNSHVSDDEKDKIILTNLGGPYDSSYLVSYFLGDIGMKNQIDTADLRTILEYENPEERIILFIDDNIGSGKQATDIFKELLGIKEKELKESHVVPLNPTQSDKLKKFKLRIFTFVSFEEGKKKILNELKKLGLNVEDIYSFFKMEEKIGCFHPTSNVFPTPEDLKKAKNMCEEIGYQIFSDKTDWPDSLKRERALGYGNSQKLIVFFYNVPTSTLPILWKRGMYRNKEWEPLFLRREKI